MYIPPHLYIILSRHIHAQCQPSLFSAGVEHTLLSPCSDRSQVEADRHEDLVDQWTLLQWERSAVLNPRAGSGLPGAPTKWDLEPGVEERVPTLFLDLNGACVM